MKVEGSITERKQLVCGRFMKRVDVIGKHGRRSGSRSNVTEVSQNGLDDLHSGIFISVIYY